MYEKSGAQHIVLIIYTLSIPNKHMFTRVIFVANERRYLGLELLESPRVAPRLIVFQSSSTWHLSHC